MAVEGTGKYREDFGFYLYSISCLPRKKRKIMGVGAYSAKLMNYFRDSCNLEALMAVARFCFCIPKGGGASLTKQTTEVDNVEEFSGIHSVCLYSYEELKTATENFSPANKIGQGGFGSVYKGTLKNGSMAAIKVLSAQSIQGEREFLTEIDVIANIEHENLVELYGCCIEGKERILVYGYLENNSLAQTLLGGVQSSIEFSWRTRHKICIGVARGLAFLHEEVKPRIIHRDIKASNILLDKNLIPKISDFGLAKLIPDYMSHVSTRVAGTMGYLAPEYAVRGHLTSKSDIYSFGVLLMELVTGRSNTNKRLPAKEQHLVEMIWEHYENGNLDALVDRLLTGDSNGDEIRKSLKIGLLCTQDLPNLRPSMSIVVKMLTGEINVDDKSISKPGLFPQSMVHEGTSSSSTL